MELYDSQNLTINDEALMEAFEQMVNSEPQWDDDYQEEDEEDYDF